MYFYVNHGPCSIVAGRVEAGTRGDRELRLLHNSVQECRSMHKSAGQGYVLNFLIAAGGVGGGDAGGTRGRRRGGGAAGVARRVPGLAGTRIYLEERLSALEERYPEERFSALEE
jgi:hypothetical protein